MRKNQATNFISVVDKEEGNNPHSSLAFVWMCHYEIELMGVMKVRRNNTEECRFEGSNVNRESYLRYENLNLRRI